MNYFSFILIFLFIEALFIHERYDNTYNDFTYKLFNYQDFIILSRVIYK
jgi:hypothetical protein